MDFYLEVNYVQRFIQLIHWLAQPRRNRIRTIDGGIFYSPVYVSQTSRRTKIR